MNNILSSIALLGELYKNGKKDIFHVVGAFIQATIQCKSIAAFDSIEMQVYLKELFQLEIPEAIIKTVLKNRLKKIIIKSSGKYIILNSFPKDDGFLDRQSQLNSEYDEIFRLLYQYVEKHKKTLISDFEKEKIKTDFIKYLLNEEITENDFIFNTFIINNSDSQSFTVKLNNIKEGLIIYSGIQYCDSNDIQQLGLWKTQLTIYLDTEHLFNLGGLNDSLYEKIFNEFYTLIQDINSSSKTNLISLKYFEETQDEIDEYFDIAESIIQGKKQLNPSKVAMINILNGCKDISDVLRKKSLFQTKIQTAGIQVETEIKISPIWNITDQTILKQLLKDLKPPKFYDEDDIVLYLNYFSRINQLRRGNNQVSFEKSKYILMTGNSLALHMANYPAIKNYNWFPFATDIEYITSKIWFKLNKSLSLHQMPITFDVVARAQLVLASQLANSISLKYDELQRSAYTKEEKVNIYNDLRSSLRLSDQISPESLPDIISFMQQPSLDDLNRQQSYYKQQAKEGVEAKEILQKKAEENTQLDIENQSLKSQISHTTRINRNLSITPIKKRIRRKFKIIYWLLYWLFPIFIIITIYFVCRAIWEPSDTMFNIFIGILTISSFVLPFIRKYRVYISQHTRKKLILEYKQIIISYFKV